MTALKDLLAKVEAGWPPDIDIPYMTPFHAVWPDWRAQQAWMANQGSLDAAKALHEAVLPGWDWLVRSDAEKGGFANVMSADWEAYGDVCDQYGNTLQKGETVAGASFHAYATAPARAWLIAVLRALIAQEEGK